MLRLNGLVTSNFTPTLMKVPRQLHVPPKSISSISPMTDPRKRATFGVIQEIGAFWITHAPMAYPEQSAVFRSAKVLPRRSSGGRLLTVSLPTVSISKACIGLQTSQSFSVNPFVSYNFAYYA
ncbi:hypothetical protein PanWU01x14_111100 [Parasponia andersonii]|uniref:Uncharacterized protein n=1 Tax=Parasponia andersonii TaxID=3476 RepID=A0A2P5CYX3_PARAD|nr:hypothetical protein PanWU01x14_111100 [Parasponia andersonii]